MKPIEWLLSDDTGTSSICIMAFMEGLKFNDSIEADIPLDLGDFGRCYRLLRRFPGWRVRLHEIGVVFPEWRPMVERWAELERLYVVVAGGGEKVTSASRVAAPGEAAAFRELIKRLRDEGLRAAGYEPIPGGWLKTGRVTA